MAENHSSADDLGGLYRDYFGKLEYAAGRESERQQWFRDFCASLRRNSEQDEQSYAGEPRHVS